jgi:hypothetical protein
MANSKAGAPPVPSRPLIGMKPADREGSGKVQNYPQEQA